MAYPLLYEINTRCWLTELSTKTGQRVTLANIPDAEFKEWLSSGFTHIWLMGVWASGPLARTQALQSSDQRDCYTQAVPDWQEDDIAGSPYAIAEYRVPARLGGDEGLKEFRRRLNRLGVRLILDFVPNHLGLDHSWVREKPEYFVQSSSKVPETFEQTTSKGLVWLAHGKDPNFAAWSDTVQLDYRQEITQTAALGTLQSVAARCDGVRCDMAMLLLRDVFTKTWQKLPSLNTQTTAEFWSSAISAVKKDHSEFMFLAEAYWGLETKLHELGFDFTYDKEWYDCLLSRQPGALQRQLLSRPPGFIEATARFLENHDEPRIATLLSSAEHKAAALLLLGLPGLRLLHEGQINGAQTRTPVTLVRRATTRAIPEIEAIYRELLNVLSTTVVGEGVAHLCSPRQAWPGNPTSENCLIVQWQQNPPDFEVAVVNLAPHRSQCYVALAITDLAAYNWSMKNLLGGEDFRRAGEDLQNQGLYLDLPAHAAQLFRFQPVA